MKFLPFPVQSIDAMDKWEDLTELGCHLADLPVDPRLGKMVLYAIVLKCLDPVLTIVCSLAYKDPCEYLPLPSFYDKCTLNYSCIHKVKVNQTKTDRISQNRF